MVLALVVGCVSSDGAVIDGAPRAPSNTAADDGDTDTDTDTDTDQGTDTDTDTDTDPPVDTGPNYDDFDCNDLPPIPAPFFAMENFGWSEDFDFDADGFVGSIDGAGNLVARNQKGEFHVISAGIGGNIAGTRLLVTGDWMIANAGTGEIIRVDPLNGAQTRLGGLFTWPNGIEPTLENDLYISDFSQGKIMQGNAYADEWVQIATGLPQANGIVLSPDEQTLWIVLSWTPEIRRMDRDKNGDWGAPEFFHQRVGGNYQGINVDMCGNVYWTDIDGGQNYIWRAAPDDGENVELVATLPSSWIPNIRWGHGIGGWKRDVLYASDRGGERIFAIQVGVPGKKHILLQP